MQVADGDDQQHRRAGLMSDAETERDGFEQRPDAQRNLRQDTSKQQQRRVADDCWLPGARSSDQTFHTTNANTM